MVKQRQSNFELLRILLMLVVPLYHLMLYSQMNHLPFHEFTIPSLLICSGGAIVADYAFMAMSAYFLMQNRKRSIFQRFIEVAIQVIILYGLKMLILRVGLGTKGKNPIFEDFFVRGAWWFIYVYLVIVLVYPLLNRIIDRLSLVQLRAVLICMGIYFIYNNLTYNTQFVNDLFSFLFVYFIIGYLNRIEYKSFLGLKNENKRMALVYIVGFLITFLVGLYIKWPGNIEGTEQQVEYLLMFIGRYSLIQCIMGIAVFLFVRNIKMPNIKWINSFSGNVFYVFLLHETVLAVLWKLGYLNVKKGILPYENIGMFFVGCISYLVISILFAVFVRFVYEKTFQKVVHFFAEYICKQNWIKKLEQKYLGE